MPFLSVRFDGNGAPEVLRAAKREVKARTKEGMVAAAEAAVLPRVRASSPSIIRDALTVKGVTKGPKVTTQGPRRFDRITGLLNFGGIVRSTIAPVRADGHQALTIAPGVIRARVKHARHYTGKHFIERGVEEGLPEMESAVLDAVLESFNGLPHRA